MMGWCGPLGPKPNASLAPTGPSGLACNGWGWLGAPLVAQAWLWGCPTPPPVAKFNGPHNLWPPTMAQDCAHELCTPHTMYSVPLGTWVLLAIEMWFVIHRDIIAILGYFYWLSGVVSVVSTVRPLPPHHYLILLYSTLTYPPPPAISAYLRASSSSIRVACRGWCVSACVCGSMWTCM